MTDRHAGYVVTLASNIREDDTEPIINALRMVSGVVDVQPVLGDYAVAVAEHRRDGAWADALRSLAAHPPSF